MNAIVSLPLAGALVSSPSISSALSPENDDVVLDKLWTQREELIRAEREMYQHCDAIEATLPAWVLQGPVYINNKSERCGAICGWPEIEKLPEPPQHADAYRRIRISPYDLKRDYESYVSMFASMKDLNAPGRRQARADYRRKMRALIKRLRDARQIRQAAGLPSAVSSASRISDERWDAGDAICKLTPSLNQTLARLIIETGYEVKTGSTVDDPDEHAKLPLMVLKNLRHLASGAVRATIDRMLDNPTTPLENLDVFPT
ncbi:hypothetical protein [Tardiphaga sp.]|uniref:hypothetical protein n=1 Tax=Tardiphaga sp. TaxID=1926292 RepID=UPI002605C191|nr:hypothetical protein [Tardiphaga sp.]MDB5616608.1 hypothetical protein [Tardiphaga sp.]